MYGIPIATMHWKDVMTLYAKDRFVVLASDPTRTLKSANLSLEFPLVIQLKVSFKRKRRRNVQFSKRNVAKRDNSQCQYCGKFLDRKEYTYDHVVPKSLGGKSSWWNLVLACQKCNSRKANKTLEQSGMKLLQVPDEPVVGDKRFQYRVRVRKIKPAWQPWAKFLKEA